MEVKSSFGDVTFDNNTGGRQSGSGNSGYVESCFNLNLDVTNCELNIVQSKDLHITASNSKIDCSSTTNSTMSGSNNTIDIVEVNNAKLVGSDNEISIGSSLDLNFVPDKSKVEARYAQNCNFSVKSMEVFLLHGYNVSVKGDSGNVRILNARNLSLTRLQSTDEGIHNMITFAKSEDATNIADVVEEAPVKLPDNLKNVSVSITFDSHVDILDQQKYTVDGVRFSIFPKEADMYEVRVSGLDADSIRQTVVSPTEIETSATKNGKKHAITFKAPQVMQQSKYGSRGLTFCLHDSH